MNYSLVSIPVILEYNASSFFPPVKVPPLSVPLDTDHLLLTIRCPDNSPFVS